MTTKEELVWLNISSILRERKNLAVVDFGCGQGLFAKSISRLGHEYIGVDIDNECRSALADQGYSVYHPDFVPNGLEVDVLLLGNMGGIETGRHLVDVRKKLKEDGVVFMWDFSIQRLPKGKSQETVAMNLVRGI